MTGNVKTFCQLGERRKWTVLLEIHQRQPSVHKIVHAMPVNECQVDTNHAEIETSGKKSIPKLELSETLCEYKREKSHQ